MDNNNKDNNNKDNKKDNNKENNNKKQQQMQYEQTLWNLFVYISSRSLSSFSLLTSSRPVNPLYACTTCGELLHFTFII